MELKDAYKKAVGPDAVAQAPFRENMAEAVRQVNAWAATNTGNRIRNLLNPQRMSDRTVLVLVNAMYLRAFWDSKFEGRDTAPRTFVREDARLPGAHDEAAGIHGGEVMAPAGRNVL